MEILNIVAHYLELRTLLLLVTLLFTAVYIITRQHNLPPGPWGLPFIGYTLHLLMVSLRRKKLPPHQYLNQLASKYGEIFCVNVCGQMFVVLNTYDMIKDAFQNPLLNDRPNNYLLEEVNIPLGIFSSSGAAWKQHRQFVTTTLRKFGVGNKIFEDNISKESTALIDELSCHLKTSFDVRHAISNSVSNIICAVVLGKRYEYTDTNFQKLLFYLNQLVKNVGPGAWHALTPFAKFVAPKDHKRIQDNVLDTNEFFIDTLNSYVPNSNNPNDFVTALASNVGRDRLPNLKDMPQLPYTHAVLREVQRIETIVPLVPHCAGDTTYVKGFKIPKGAFVIANVWAVHNDPTVWKEPEEFRPSRFLDESGKLRLRKELIPFSIGRRACVGENLAKMELSIFFTHMLHKFSFSKPNERAPLTFDGVVGLTYAPKPFEVVIQNRNQSNEAAQFA